jgi:5-methylcytosine-specific restriction endonuclease McrA
MPSQPWTFCLDEPPWEVVDAAARLDTVGRLVVDGDLQAARHELDKLNHKSLRLRWFAKSARRRWLGWKDFTTQGDVDKMPMPAQKIQRAIFEADGFRCRYCQIPIVDTEARKHLVNLLQPFGEPLLWDNFDAGCHAALLNLKASCDHVVPKAVANMPDATNLVTSCSFCNFGKGGATLEFLHLLDPRGRPPIINEWDGLRRVLEVSLPAPMPSAARTI